MGVPIPNDWEGEYCCYSVEWPKSKQYLAILRGLIDSAAGGRFYIADTGSITAAQEIIRATFDYNFQNYEVIMSCGDDINNGLLAIAAALNNQAAAGGGAGCCGGGSAGGGQYDPPPGGVDTTGEDPEDDPPPEGFPSWEAYETQRCGVATQIMEQLQDSLVNMGFIIVSGLSVEALVELLIVALSLTVSTAGLAAIAGLILTVGGVIICATALSLVNDNFQDLVCALLSGTNSATSRANFLTKWGEIVDDASIDPIESFAIKQLIGYLIGFEVVNRMYIPTSSIDYSGYSCPGCDEPEDCTTFNDGELHGYTPATDCCIFFDPFPVFGTLTADLDAVACSGENSGGTRYATLLSPVQDDHVVIEGDTLCLNISEDTSSGVFNEYLEIMLDGVWTDLGHGTGSIIGIREFNLDAYAGMTLTRWQFGWSQNSDFDVYVTTTGLNCLEC